MTADAMLASEFATLPDLLRAHAGERADKIAIGDAASSLTYAALDARMDRVAVGLQAAGVRPGGAVAIVGAASVDYACVFLAALRIGAAAAPIAPSATPDQIAAMIADSGAPIVFLDDATAAALADHTIAARIVTFGTAFDAWLPPAGARPAPVTIAPADPFNIIYSSGTTGTPKGIVQSHAMRWAHIGRNSGAGFGEAVTLLATPLYSNTTLVSFLPTLGWGGTAILMAKFDARQFLELAERYRATHTMLVPVQYQRIMALPDFDRFDLSAFRLKTCTSAPFSAALKADVLARWPGLLVEYYGMTEGGASTMLVCNAHPDKLHTVGVPIDGHDMRLIDDDGNEVAPGAMGEVVGRSPSMMNGYHGREEATRAAEWHDADGFLILMDRKKDMIISGGFNIYPSDLEAVLRDHPDVADCSVIGVPSDAWGETPVGFFVPARAGVDADAILAATNARLGKTQRLAALHAIDVLPRSAIGKVLKRELRDRLATVAA